ncbi:C4-dicarboxylate ABC transporter [Allostella vacuolata]|nr:C4-dicarboxylate ABC transporter [Stella vacuolata]
MIDFVTEYLAIIMFAVLAALLFTGFPVGYVLGGVSLIFGLIGYGLDVFSLIEFSNLIPRIWGGAAENLVLVAVPMFIFMGIVLEKSGVAEDLLRCMQILLRRVPGGLAMAVVLMGTIMAASTGIIGASVIMITMLAMPVMIERGYARTLSAGTIAASGTLGILIPPSIMLVIMADLLGISVGTLFYGAMVPGLLLSGLYLLYVFLLSRLKPALAPPLPADQFLLSRGELARMVLKSFVPPAILVTLVLGSIFFGFATPTEAAGVGALGAVILAIANRRLDRQATREVIDSVAKTLGMVFLVFIGATAFSYVFRSLGGDDIVVDALRSLDVGPWGILLILMGIIFLLGFFFDWVEIILILMPVFAPIVKILDFGDHVPSSEVIYWFALLVAVNLQNSFLTPPFGFALFYLKGAAPPSVTIGHIYRGIIPFVMLQVIGLLLIIGFPDLALWLPRLMLE